jgi:putative endonuclease
VPKAQSNLRLLFHEKTILCLYSYQLQQYGILYRVTSNLIRRVYEHKLKLTDGFTNKYKINKLVYYEIFEDIENALIREKKLKGSSRKRKLNLINSMNRDWRDLYQDITS